MCVRTRVVKLLLCAYYYYYYYYFIYLNSLLLLLLLLLEMHGEPITITMTRNIKKAYYYYYYFPDYYYYYYYYFPITITFIITVEPKKHNTSILYKVIFKDLYYVHGITHYHRHFITDIFIIKLSWKFYGVLLSNRESNSLLLANVATYYYYYYYYR